MTGKNRLVIVLVANDTCRVAKLRNAVHESGIDCTIRRLAIGKKASAYLANPKPLRHAPAPDLIFFDLADLQLPALQIARDIAFGERSSPVPVVFLTSAASESMLASGELDDGQSTMFAARPLDTFLAKLANHDQNGFLRAVTTLNQYGPLLVRQPKKFLECRTDNNRLSA